MHGSHFTDFVRSILVLHDYTISAQKAASSFHVMVEAQRCAKIHLSKFNLQRLTMGYREEIKSEHFNLY